MKVHIVIVNYRTADLTIDCLASLRDEVIQRGDVRVTVTDNLSGDDSVSRIQNAIDNQNWADWCTLLPLPKNGGFAYGNNRGIERHVDAPFTLLLNPDTVVRPGAIGKLVDCLEANPKIGIVGSRLEDPDTTPQRSAFRFHSIASELEGGLRLGLVSKLLARRVVAPPVSDVPHPIDWVAGASMMIRKEVFDAIGLLDEAYFMYFEEVDFCLRARRAGFQCWYEPASRVVHLVGQASGVTSKSTQNKRRPAYWFESRRRYFIKNHGRFHAMLADAAFMIGFTFWRIRRKLQRKPDPDPAHLLGDFARHSAIIKGGSA